MREITTKLYQYDELPTDEAKQQAQDWCRNDSNMKAQDVWEQTKEDAENVGLKIITLDDHKANAGEFIGTALETLESILKEYGTTCDTYKTAERYETSLRVAVKSVNQDDAEACDDLEDIETEFLADLLEDYRVICNQNLEYAYSEEAIVEDIRANEYEFTEEGKRA